MNKTFDIAVVGGGPAGAATALSIRRQSGLTVALVEKTDYGQPRVGETLSPGARSLLEYLEAWQAFEQAGHAPAYGNAAAWGNDAIYQRDFMFTPFGHGWHLDRRRFDADLVATAEHKGVVVYRNTLLEHVEREDGGCRLRLRQGEDTMGLTARFVVDASGKGQVVARKLGAERQLIDNMVALVAEYPAMPDADTFTLVEPCAQGWFYSACLPAEAGGRTWWVALMTDADLIQQHELRAPEVWWRLLNGARHTMARLAGAQAPVRLQVVSAHSALLEPLYGQDWVAVGDAAGSYDPLSSSGIVRALDAGIHTGMAVVQALAGNRAALAQLAERHVGAYQQYLGTRASYYQMEQRWPDSNFWRRRQAVVTLAPDCQLVSVPKAVDTVAWPADLQPLEPASLLSACSTTTAAAAVVAAHPQRTEVGDERIILGLQWLLQAGLLAIAKPGTA
ncbi:tryptophan 7-halogenase [Chitinimonas viridis]|uniref:Tryptophan 7-halogenase n=1 Tax=Chitinimonas viridis TaxID=664880 RepID=A0ABT8B5U6_9NEIS|nr:tryptophan 7-halogenase [Chitinimonas viridis]MDN3577115.1 tryptophan 7-halogenase [Chitinimonas viridis]